MPWAVALAVDRASETISLFAGARQHEGADSKKRDGKVLNDRWPESGRPAQERSFVVPGLASKPVWTMALLALLVPSPTSSSASIKSASIL